MCKFTKYRNSQICNYASSISEITIPNSTTTLGDAVFHYCLKLKKITIGNNVTKIPENMLWYTGAVEEITIKGNITEIGATAFEDNGNLKKAKHGLEKYYQNRIKSIL